METPFTHSGQNQSHFQSLPSYPDPIEKDFHYCYLNKQMQLAKMNAIGVLIIKIGYSALMLAVAIGIIMILGLSLRAGT